MEKIKFSHDYPKLHSQTTAELVAVRSMTVEGGLNPSLKEYDTKTVDGSYYPITDGEYLQLIFVGDLGIPFCTLRRMTAKKVEYYNKNIGKWFEIGIAKEIGK